MFCGKCGKQNPENAVFCANCGASMNTQQAQPVKEQSSEQNYQQSYQPPQKVYSTNPVINAIKKIASSGVSLAAIICITVCVAMSILSIFSMAGTLDLALETLESFGIDYRQMEMFDTVMDIIESTTVVSGIISLTPIILVVIGFWLIFAAARDTQNQGMKTAGLTIIKVITIIQLVFFCIGMGLALILILIGALASLVESPAIGAIILVLLLLVIGIFVVYLLVYAKALSTINSIKASLLSGNNIAKVSMYLIVMLYIMGGTSILSFSLAGILQGVAYILFGVTLNMLRNELNQLKHPKQF